MISRRRAAARPSWVRSRPASVFGGAIFPGRAVGTKFYRRRNAGGVPPGRASCWGRSRRRLVARRADAAHRRRLADRTAAGRGRLFPGQAYLLDEKNWQHWPAGSDVGISVTRISRARRTPFIAPFHRAFRRGLNLAATADDKLDTQLKTLEAQGYATLRQSGTFRDLTKQLPHIVQKARLPHPPPAARAIRHPRPMRVSGASAVLTPHSILTALIPRSWNSNKRATGN